LLLSTMNPSKLPPLVVNRSFMPFELDQGLGCAVRIGLAALAGNQTTEYEFHRMLDLDGVAFYTARVPDSVTITPDTLRETERHLAQAVSQILPGIPLDVVAFTCTSATIVNGEEAIFARIREVRSGVACTTPITAALAAMQALKLKRIALLTPYIQEINDQMREFIQDRGVDVPVMGSFNNSNDHEVARITPKSIRNAVLELAQRDEVEGVFVSCGSLRLVDMVEDLESSIGKPVFSSNHAMAWHCLRLGGYDAPIAGLGRLFRIGIASPAGRPAQ